MRKLYGVLANIVVILHVLVGAFLLVGWMFPEIKYLYLIVLIGWPLCWIIFHSCPLTKLEFEARRKSQPWYRRIPGISSTPNPDDEFIATYARRLFGVSLSPAAVYTGGLCVFLLLVVLFYVSNFL